MTTTTTASTPTDLEVERYVQLAALWIVISGNAFQETLGELLPNLSYEQLVFEITDRDRGFSHESLFRRCIPGDRDGTPAVALTEARVDQLIARLYRALDAKSFAGEAAYFERLATDHLIDAHSASQAAS